MKHGYKQDLAYIHDIGFSDYALKSAAGILEIIESYHIREGLIVDLGCGSGLSAQELIKNNYRVFGVDWSQSLIEIARHKVPDAEFQVGSLFQVNIPVCNAVLSIGECLNYLFDSQNNHQTLMQLFRRIYNALTPGGVFIFDIAEPGQVTTITKGFTEGEDWVVLVEKQENPQNILTRRIITFRKVGENYRRDDELHQLQLYSATEIAKKLRQVGFQIQMMRHYGQFHLPPAHIAFVAHKLSVS